MSHLPPGDRDDTLNAYRKRLEASEGEAKLDVARAFCKLGLITIGLVALEKMMAQLDDPVYLL